MEHELTLIGSKMNHLPAALFRLYGILQQNYAGQYHETGEAALSYCKEDNTYVSGSDVLTPMNTVITVAYEETGGEETPCRYVYSVRLQPLRRSGMDSDSDAGCDTERGAYTLTIPCTLAFLQQYYYPVRRFLHANPAKYVQPGISHAPAEGMTVAVIDTEMQRPYITQFSGVILRYYGGTWTIQESERLNVYIRLPEGVRVDPYIRKVTGLTRRFLDANGIEEEPALDQIAAFLSRADLVCGHAVLSDIEILRERYLLSGRIPDPSVLDASAARDLAIANVSGLSDDLLAGRLTHALFPASVAQSEIDRRTIPDCLLRSDLIDTQVLMEYLYDLSGMIKLERAAELTGVVSENDVFHDARTDADVTARLLVHLWPEFVNRYGVMPIVNAAMMHAARETSLLNPIVGKTTPARPVESGTTRRHKRGRSNTNHRHTPRRTVSAERRRRKRIT